MSNITYYESRSGSLTCSAAEAFNFVTDIRNFERFVPKGTIDNWHAEKESCNFSVSMLGKVTIALIETERFTKVVYIGDALSGTDFKLTLKISDYGFQPAVVKILLSADLNPMMKMMAVKPITQFLEMLISEMEKFNDWKKTKE